MFPTFISILDIQSWWEVPSIAHFCSLFRSAFNLLDFDIEDLEEALLTDGTEESSWLQELIVRLLSGCLPKYEISTFNYQMFLRRLFRQKCQKHKIYNPFNTDIDFQLLPLRTKVDILHALCDFRLDANDVLDQLKNLEADSLRVEPLGYDGNGSAYWYFYGTRLYREDFKSKIKKESVWQVICFTEEDWFQLTKKFSRATSKIEKKLHRTLSKNFLPELPRLFREKERLARKRLLEKQPRRTSSRLRKVDDTTTEEQKKSNEITKDEKVDEEEYKRLLYKQKRQEAYERRVKLKEQEESSQSEKSESRYEMAGAKTWSKKNKTRQRKHSENSVSGKDQSSVKSTTHDNNKKNVNSNKTSTSTSGSTTVGRQTNNSLASATGQIVIQPVSNPNRKKLKTSQVFSQTEEDLQTGMHKILDHVKNHEDAWPFIDPVEEEYAPNYYSIIRKPMDLQRMEERLDSGHYKTYSRFRGDFQLIVDNCRLYNGAENEYTEMVDNLLKVFERATKRYLDQISSSDDEIAVEYPDTELDSKLSGKKKKNEPSSKQKPTLAAQTDKKRSRSTSEESTSKRSESLDSFDRLKSEKVQSKQISNKSNKKQIKNSKSDKHKTNQSKKDKKKFAKTEKKFKHSRNPMPDLVPERSRSRSRSFSPVRSHWSSSPPPSWPPSSPDSRFDFSPKKNKKRSYDSSDDDVFNDSKGKKKEKHDKWKEIFKDDIVTTVEKKNKKEKEVIVPPKPKDKHNKLRETIEKLKAKSEMSKVVDSDKTKGNKEKQKKLENDKNKNKSKSNKNSIKKNVELDDGNSTADSIKSDKKLGKKATNTKNNANRNAAIEALTIATEQTLKDINKWLDDTPKYSEFSSASNSPSYGGLDEFDGLGNKIEQDYQKKVDKSVIRKDGIVKDTKRKQFHRDPGKFLKRREIQRTIDRLQPGKSKGNLLSNIQNSNKPDDLFPLGPLSKLKDTKNSLIVKTDDNAPKLSLGTVLDSFGKHKFVDDVKNEEEEENINNKTKNSDDTLKSDGKNTAQSEDAKNTESNKKNRETIINKDTSPGKATPNLSAWFKAFGAPKVQVTQKKPENKTESKDDKNDDVSHKTMIKSKEDPQKVVPPDPSPNSDSTLMPYGQPVPRQRKISTGSSVSERSSFSQDMDSPRVGIDERLGAYPAPYPSPLHRSPSGASPVMASPRPDVSPKAAAYPTFNGQIRVGFYQDTVSTKSSPDKSCSPRDNPQSPYGQYSEHVYTPPVTTNTVSYSYGNPPYYSQTPSYSSINPTPPYSSEQANYYDTNKALTDQYQAKTVPNYPSNSPLSNVNTHSSPTAQHSSVSTFRQEKTTQSAIFPVKKRAYNDTENVQYNTNRFEISSSEQEQEQYSRNMDAGLLAGRQGNVGNVNEPTPLNIPSPNNREKQYVHQNVPEPKMTVHTTNASYSKSNTISSVGQHQTSQESTLRNLNYSMPPNEYNHPYANDSYPLNIPTARSMETQQDLDKKIDIAKYTNMGYSGSEVNFVRNVQYSSYPHSASTSGTSSGETQQSVSSNPQSDMSMRFPGTNTMPQAYKGIDMIVSNSQQTSHLTSLPTASMHQNARVSTENINSRLEVPSGYKPSEMSIPRPSYSSPSTLEMDQSLSLRGNLANLTHIVDRYPTDERMLTGLQSTGSPYYGEKNLSSAHMFTKPISTSSSALPMFSQPNMAIPYSPNMQATSAAVYNRQLTELQSSCSGVGNQDAKAGTVTQPQQHHQPPQQQQQQPQQQPPQQQQQQQPPQQQPPPERKSKRRKTAKNAAPASLDSAAGGNPAQGFQSYAGLKNNPPMEPSAISLKTTSVVPGSAFNFGPTPSGLSLGSGLYGDKEAYPNFLEDFRTSAPNYYMAAAAAAHHRSTPETSEKQARTAHQSNPSQTPGYPFLGAPQPRPPSYSLGAPFMPPHQAPLMDANSPLYQQYLQAGVLHQGLLGPPGAYTPGYHPALSMRQPYDSMTRPPWL